MATESSVEWRRPGARGPDGGNPLHDGGTRRPSGQPLLERDDGELTAHDVEQFAGLQQEIRIRRAPELFIPRSERFVEQSPVGSERRDEVPP